ncbi:hypothetical protein I7I53_02437 [Histoplasma capsulatum var. duboisii H88]|uniref:Uncharacterized protein n=1 Tax=Ajellomyces capsulatus (strain H88) TaxID=544711 RepID=A0A8A1LNW1_AJEC8|nr:hypothetical protein I7I53_02437 [Histoplasma capsulatum var. duboisii H88]
MIKFNNPPLHQTCWRAGLFTVMIFHANIISNVTSFIVVIVFFSLRETTLFAMIELCIGRPLPLGATYYQGARYPYGPYRVQNISPYRMIKNDSISL